MVIFAAAETHVVTQLSPLAIGLIAFFSSTLAVALPLWIPLLMASRRKSKDAEEALHAKQKDWEREDAVAKRVEDAAALLLERQTLDTAKMDETAKLLLASNALSAKSSEETHSKLDVIHDLVNNEMTETLHRQLDETVRGLASLKEIMALHLAAGRKPSADSLAVIKATEIRIALLQKRIQERVEQQAAIDAKKAARTAMLEATSKVESEAKPSISK